MSEESNQHRPVQSIDDGRAAAMGSLAGGFGGILLGLLIAWSTGPGWSLTSVIIVAHVTLAMIAMGAWCGPSIVSDPTQEEGTMRNRQAADSPVVVVDRDLGGDRKGSSADAPLVSV
jgi:hypothetical protein